MRSLSAPVSIAARALSEDPFADVHAVSHQEFTIDALPPPRAARTTSYVAYSTPSAYSYSSAAPTKALRDDQRTAKLVASVLLSRAGGRPMRRRPQPSEEKTYIKSGLSRLVEVEAA